MIASPAPSPAEPPSAATDAALRIAAISSDGGHLIQLQRLQPFFAGFDTTYFISGHGKPKPGTHYVRDFSRSNPWVMPLTFLQVFGHFLRRRPHVVVTTGAAPGLVGILAGRLIGAKTIWLDSIANTERLSGSGRVAKRLAHHCLSQWPEVAAREKVIWIGNVL